MRLGSLLFDVIAIVAALGIRYLSPSGAWIEIHYSNGLYPAIDRGVRALTGPLPFTLGDVVLLAALAVLVTWWARTLRASRLGRRLPTIGSLALRTVALAALGYLWFDFSWAFNYSRIPLSEKIPVHKERTNEDSVRAFADHVVDELNANVVAAHRELRTRHTDDVSSALALEPRFEKVIARLGDRSTFTPPRVKPTIFQPLFEASATTGLTDPWTHEVNLDASVFAFERPALYAHEWAHVAGFADETEANLIAVLACTTSPDPLLRYSGWTLTWFNLPSDIRVRHRLKRQAYDDIRAVIARYRKHVKPQVERASRLAYDRYLKANRVKAGYESYHLFVRWLAGADFDRDGLPIVRSSVR